MEELEYKILNFVIYYIILLFFMVNSNFSFGYNAESTARFESAEC